MRVAVALMIGLAGCAGHPLGEDFESLDAAAREVRAGEALEDLLSFRVAGGERARDRWVSRADRDGVEYARNGVTSTLRWVDVDSVDGQSAFDVPGRPVTLYVYLAEQSPSTETVRDKIVPSLASAGLALPYVRLDLRPRGSRNRMRAALAEMNRARARHPAPARAVEAPRDASTLEERLRRLKKQRDDGLIEEAEYEARRRELLRGL